MSEVCQVSVPYASCAPWVVRCEDAVLGRFTSAVSARSAARVYASDLRRRLGVPVSVVVEDAPGRWQPCRPPVAATA
jgi:hypothetical protein